MKLSHIFFRRSSAGTTFQGHSARLDCHHPSNSCDFDAIQMCFLSAPGSNPQVDESRGYWPQILTYINFIFERIQPQLDQHLVSLPASHSSRCLRSWRLSLKKRQAMAKTEGLDGLDGLDEHSTNCNGDIMEQWRYHRDIISCMYHGCTFNIVTSLSTCQPSAKISR